MWDMCKQPRQTYHYIPLRFKQVLDLDPGLFYPVLRDRGPESVLPTVGVERSYQVMFGPVAPGKSGVVCRLTLQDLCRELLRDQGE